MEKLKPLMSRIIIRCFRSMLNIILKSQQIKRYLHKEVLDSVMDQRIDVRHDGVELKFATPNDLSYWRAKTFSTKEPETLEWIDSLDKDSVLWDVGANVGLYSLYAAIRRNCKVFAFEPSVFNLELLARNVFLNGLSEKVCIVPLALNEEHGPNVLHMTTTQWGGALSTFGQGYGWDGKPMQEIFEFQTVGLSMEDAIRHLAIPQPDYIKMDVDGIEHLILRGGSNVLLGIKSILIEVNDGFDAQAHECQALLKEAGLYLREKRHAKMFDRSQYAKSFNQIWFRH